MKILAILWKLWKMRKGLGKLVQEIIDVKESVVKASVDKKYTKDELRELLKEVNEVLDAVGGLL